MTTLAQYVRQFAAPLAAGRFIPDWAARAHALGSLTDIAACSAREDAYWSPESAGPGGWPLSLRPTRAIAAEGWPRLLATSPLGLNMDFVELQGSDHALVADAVVGLDAAEKIVISAAAWCLCELTNPPELVLDLMNLVYEEALHLEAVGRLLGTDHSQAEWIPEDRRANWDLVRQCGSPIDYMVIEHRLYEGRGTVASAAGVFHLERAGATRVVVDVFAAIARQEANHNVTGFRWLTLLGGNRPAHERRLAELVRRFLEAEPLPELDGTARSLRKHFPLYLVDLYRRTSDFYRVKQAIVSASRSARRTGTPGVHPDRLYRASAEVVRWSESLEDRT